MDTDFTVISVAQFFGLPEEEKVIFDSSKATFPCPACGEYDCTFWDKPAACTIPPEGWKCTRVAGHDGPCAAVPVKPIQRSWWQRILDHFDRSAGP